MKVNAKYSSQTDIGQHAHDYQMLNEEHVMKKIMNPGDVDESKWSEAKKISEESYGEHKWPFIMWTYKHRLGGK